MSIHLDLQLGLGDCIIANGLIREYCKLHDLVTMPCYLQNFMSVSQMFSDLTNLRILPPDTEVEGSVVSIGCNNPKFGTAAQSFDEAMYKLADVNFEKRWTSFFMPEQAYVRKVPENKFLLIHDDRDRGYIVDNKRLRNDLEIVYINKDNFPIAHWLPCIREAREIHCINSSILHLVESVETKGSLYFHRYARPYTLFDLPVLTKHWNVLE